MTQVLLRQFTVAQANATLPLVRRIVRDLLELHPRWRAAVVEFEVEQNGVSASGETAPSRAARLEAGRLAGDIESCLDELDQVGCVFKGFDTGLVDFPAMIDGREVYLCWQFDEPAVTHWHEVDGGYAGRQPIDAFHFPDDAT